MKKIIKPGKIPIKEHILQKSIVAYLRSRGYRTQCNDVFNAVKYINGENKRIIEISHLKAMGAGKGYPDLTAHCKDETIYIEIKTDKGRLSPEQKEWQEFFTRAGRKYIVARSVMDLMAAGI